MIDFPPSTYIPLISSTEILYFKHLSHDKNAPPHNFVTIPGTNNHLITVTISSQIEKISSWYTGRNLEGLIILEPNTLNYLPLKSLINCNSPDMYSREDFVKKVIDPTGPWIIRGRIDDGLDERIKTAIKNSILAKPKIVKALG